MEDIFQADITTAPLTRRAWVVQERLLAPRVLHLGSRQVYWECSEYEACETFIDGLPRPLRKNYKRYAQIGRSSQLVSSLSEQDQEMLLNQSLHLRKVMLDIWRRIKIEYNDKDLTYYSDKLIAVSGLAREIQSILKEPFIAGMWKETLLPELIWCCSPELESQRPKPQQYQAPSWSWLSVNERVTEVTRDNSTPIAEILDYHVEHSGIDITEFGRITGGYIRIRGRLSRASFVHTDEELRTKNKTANYHPLRLSSIRTNLSLRPYLFPDNYKPYLEVRKVKSYPLVTALGSRDFYLLSLMQADTGWIGMILEHTGVKGCYQRKGLWSLPRNYTENGVEEEFIAFGSHVPLLNETEYEERVDDTDCILRII
jgi:hypothetical protein